MSVLEAPEGSAREQESRSLLEAFRDDSPLFFASSRQTLLAHREQLVQHSWCKEGELEGQLRTLEMLRQKGKSSPRLAAAFPFHADEPAAVMLLEDAAMVPRRSLDLPAVTRRGLLATHASYQVQLRPSPEHYVRAVEQALSRISQGELAKIVISRSMELSLDEPIAPTSLLRHLVAHNRTGYAFSLAIPGPKLSTLMGVSPELLLEKRGAIVTTNPLAGSRPRGRDRNEDEQLARTLLVSEKDLHEHAVVIEAVVEALRPFCRSLQVPAAPSLVSTPTMWHLSTPITGELRDPRCSSLSLVRALHPTPAVCGEPRSIAEQAIRELEGFSRGLFAGAVGHCDADGNGEWAVTLRCAELSESTLRLCAGAGVVAGSDPWAEFDETAAKLSTVLSALGLFQSVVRA